MPEKCCNRCGKVRDHAYRTVKGRRYLRTTCKTCESQKRDERRSRHGQTEARRAAVRRASERRRKQRADGEDAGRFILYDSRQCASRRGLPHTLTREQIDVLIAQSCRYCGDTELRPTLDRIDNAAGYTPENVLPACVRCNYLRRDMPYEAWLQLVPAVRRARKRGLFGDWVPGPKRVARRRATKVASRG
jgi:hypothetical protein